MIRRAWTERRFARSPEGAGTLAALAQLADRAGIREGDRAVRVNTTSTEKYLPTIGRLLGGGLRTKGTRPRTVSIGMIRLVDEGTLDSCSAFDKICGVGAARLDRRL
jgi:hypothetical protein